MEKLQDSGILNQYNIVAIAYKHSPYFNLSWFRLCRDSADNVVNLGAKLAELLDPNAYRIVKEGPKNNGILGENEVNVIKLRKFKDTGKFIIEIKNNRYQRIRLYENDFKILYEFNNKLRSLRNLKQFHCSELSELAPLALKSLKKAKKRL